MSGWLASARRTASHTIAWSSTSSTMTWYSGGGNNPASSSGAWAGPLVGESLMQGGLPGDQRRQARADFINGQNVGGGLHLGRRLGHPIDRARGPVLHNRVVPRVVQGF